MAGSSEPKVAPVSLADQGTTMGFADTEGNVIGLDELNEAFTQAQRATKSAAQYS
jgi:hypothetical protein